MQAFAQILQEARAEASISQQELARRMGCARSFISAMENGVYQPTLNSFMVVCEALDLAPEEIFKRFLNRLILLQELRSNGVPGF